MRNLRYSENSPCPFRSLFIHDGLYIGETKAETLTGLGYPTDYLNSPNGIERILRGETGLSPYEVIFIHKDFADDGAGRVLRFIREEAPHIRMIVVSNEYDAGAHHVFSLMADAYCALQHITPEDRFGLLQIEKGSLSVPEIAKRGRELVTPDGVIRLRHGRIERF